MKTKILKLLQEAKSQKEIDDIVDEFAIPIIFDYEMMDALRDARKRLSVKEVFYIIDERKWEVYELN
jgi:allophanate hydrolase subunit 1